MAHGSNPHRLARWFIAALVIGAGGLGAQPQPVVVAPPTGDAVTPTTPVQPPREPATPACPQPRAPHAHADAVTFRPGLYRDRVVVKLRDAVDPQLPATRPGTAPPRRFVAASGAPASAAVAALDALLADPAVRGIRPHFSLDPRRLRELRARAEARSCRGLARLETYYWIDLADGSHGEELATRLNRSSLVEVAFLPPIPRDADNPPTTADFESGQGYLEPASAGGIDARYAWTVDGGRGAGMRVIDVEANWNVNHEDLPSPFWFSGTPGLNEISDFVNSGDINTNHGTAVAGILVARADGHGVTGIAADARWGAASVIVLDSLRGALRGASGIHDASVADAVVRATGQLAPGDAILVEQHSPGPPTATSCPCNCTQFEFVPMEYFPDSFDAIATATASGIVVVEAAGNGSVDLDRPEYEGRFDRTLRDSGAILVGATNPASLTPSCFTNRGSRVDVNGWGDGVSSTGYGDVKANGSDVNQFYTTTFSGTSSASPIVTGAVLALQGALKANGHGVLMPEQVRDVLVETGRFPASAVPAPGLPVPPVRIDPRAGLAGLSLARSPIGPRPDLRAALSGFESATASAGGGGGDPFTLRCDAGMALVGVRGRAGAFIDQVRGICAVADGSTLETAKAGGSGGDAFVLRCNDGRVVTGLRGRAGAFVDSLRLDCSEPSDLAAVARTTDAAGGNGGASFGPMHCADGRMAIGLRGRAGLVVDRLQLLCAERSLDAAVATPWVSRAVGGSGGSAATLACPAGQVMAGISARSGWWLDRIAPLCVATTAAGNWVGSPAAGTGAGGSGGTSTRLTCPRDHAIVSISGKAAAYVDQLRLRCATLDAAGTVRDDATFLGSVGGTGGSEFTRITCPARLAASGFAVRSASYVDQIKLICGQ
ncbi:MAG TPA: S8 family serine peptidase [Dokdonella sp.]|nr:S8 family serine peptidase [Dokdonella sp.]